MARLVLEELDDRLVRQIRLSAEMHNRTVEAEVVEILASHVQTPRRRREWIDRAAEIARMTPAGVPQTDSVLLLREDRDR